MRLGDGTILVVIVILTTVQTAYQHPFEVKAHEKFFSHHLGGSDTLVLKRKLFIYRDELFSSWSRWGNCSREDCSETRFRRCLNDSYEERITNLIQTNSCPFLYIAETRRCRNDADCLKDEPSVILLNQATTCGIRPNKTSQRRTTSTKILGGGEAKPHSWPWQVALYVNWDGRPRRSASPETPFCGATLVAPNWLITAAHCLSELVPHKVLPVGVQFSIEEEMELMMSVRVGDHTRGRFDGAQETSHVADKALIHPEYQRGFSENGFDIALLRLEVPAQFGEKVSSICVPDRKLNLPEGHTCFAAGWGANSPGPPVGMDYFPTGPNLHDIFSSLFGLKSRRRWLPSQPLKLHEVDLRLVSLDRCRRNFRNLREWVHICAGERGKDTCRGDSGGGLFCRNPDDDRWYIYGVTSFGSGRGCGKNYGVYTCTRGISEWIHRNVS